MSPAGGFETGSGVGGTPRTAWQIRWGLGLLAVTLAGLGLRVMALDRHSFWYDEVFVVRLMESSPGELFLGQVKDLGNPPLYPLVVQSWSALFGGSDVALRAVSVLLSVLTIPALGLLGRRLIGPTAGLFAAALLAISPLSVEFANEARPYALLHLLAVLCTLFFVRWLAEGRRLDLVLYSGTMALSWYTHYYAFALPVAHGVGLALSPLARRRALPWLGAMAASALLWATWLPSFVESLAAPGNLSRMDGRWAFQFLATPLVFGLGRTFAWRDSSLWLLGLGTAAAVLAFGWPALRGMVALRRRNPAGPVLTSWLLIPVLGPLAVALLLSPLYHTRAGSIGLPAFLLLVGYGLERCCRLERAALGTVIVVLSAVSLFRYSTQPLKDDWRSASPVILRGVREGEPVLFDPDHEVSSFSHHVPRSGSMPATMVGLMRGSGKEGDLLGVEYRDGKLVSRARKDLSAQILSSPGIWLVLCVPNGSPGEYRRLFGRHGYDCVEEHHFHRIDVYRFARAGEAGSFGAARPRGGGTPAR